MTYLGELTRAMQMLAEDARAVFVGQAVAYPGQRAHQTFEGVPMGQRIEMPVAENFQMGFSTGLALQGNVVLSFFPRMDFLICAMDQLVNHLDKLPEMGAGSPKVIIRTAIGASEPLNPGPQHTQDHRDALRLMLHTIPVIDLPDAQSVVPRYRKALEIRGACIVVEHMRLY